MLDNFLGTIPGILGRILPCTYTYINIYIYIYVYVYTMVYVLCCLQKNGVDCLLRSQFKIVLVSVGYPMGMAGVMFG